MSVNTSILSAIKSLSPASVVFNLLYKMYKQVGAREDADEIYKNTIVILEELLQRGYRFESPEIQAVVNILRDLPAMGAKRANFEKRYLQDEYTLRRLPHDPRKLYGQGCWH
ncbi:hypothetical protein [Vibrio spartinae]|uniref:Uncharacterized protein n=1 Tax=Vibrio spartinae TaxID=1918945 RepID=A0A1N6M8J6_9VIBR|nr:hypothetical protein [Vibrio spartinae]SIO95765.1 hypothetical protein VSP9026_03517 [Vibrio spartinae]